jgi:hypothetical protein
MDDNCESVAREIRGCLLVLLYVLNLFWYSLKIARILEMETHILSSLNVKHKFRYEYGAHLTSFTNGLIASREISMGASLWPLLACEFTSSRSFFSSRFTPWQISLANERHNRMVHHQALKISNSKHAVALKFIQKNRVLIFIQTSCKLSFPMSSRLE